MRTLLTGALAVLLGASLVEAQAPPAPNTAYRYVDERGGIHWAQSIHQVPTAYAEQATVPDFRDASLFPSPKPYVKPKALSTIAVTLPNQAYLASLHGSWASEVHRRVIEAWKGRGQEGLQPTLAFYVLRNGQMSVPEVERSSGDLVYDLKAREAVIALRRMPPLPVDFSGARLHVQLVFANVK